MAAKKKKAKPKTVKQKSAAATVLLSSGNPQIAKGDGDAPVKAYIAAMPGWKHDVGKRIDALIARTVPNLQKTVKWNTPFYGVEDRGFFLSLYTYAKHVQVSFFLGTSLTPVPPVASKVDGVRYLNIREGELDEAQLTAWVKQAAALPGIIPWA